MLYLHKILPALVLPLGLCILLLGVALFWRKRIFILIPLIILLLASNPLVSSFLLSRLENRFLKIEILDCPKADAVVVLSGILGGKRSGRGSLELNWGEAYDRFDAGIRLFQAGKAPSLVLTDPRVPWEEANDFSEGRQLVAAAVERGIPRERITLLGPVGNTADEARLVRQEASTRGWQRVILVTTAWHMPRSMLLFDSLPCEVLAFPTDYQVAPPPKSIGIMHMIPNAKALLWMEVYLREQIGICYYQIAKLLNFLMIWTPL